MRLRSWARRDADFGPGLRSKSQLARAVSEQRLLVNSEPAEPARILRQGDLVELLSLGCATSPPPPPKQRLCQPARLEQLGEHTAVCWKPRGMRACGAFAGTLQSSLPSLLPPQPDPGLEGFDPQLVMVSRLDSGCAGLCLVARTRAGLEQLQAAASAGELIHTFIALVHGRAPEEWASSEVRLQLPPEEESTTSQRQRRNAKARQRAAAASAGAQASAAGPTDPARAADEAAEYVAVHCEGTTNFSGGSCLSTLRLACGERSGRLCAALCATLRRAGHPIVGDRYAGSCAASLPRACQLGSLGKQKLMLTCVGVSTSTSGGGVQAEIAAPSLFRAEHWGRIEREGFNCWRAEGAGDLPTSA
eukprot:COSAG04_NODE_695_length_11066_cov_14.905352_1_plen_362_part_00